MWIKTAEGWKQLSPQVCLPANGIYRPVTLAVARAENAVRVNAYTKSVNAYVRGDLALERVYDCWNADIFGPVGEVIR